MELTTGSASTTPLRPANCPLRSPKYRKVPNFGLLGPFTPAKGNLLMLLRALQSKDRPMPTFAAVGCGLRASRQIFCCLALAAIVVFSSGCSDRGASAAGDPGAGGGGGGGKGAGRKGGGGDV